MALSDLAIQDVPLQSGTETPMSWPDDLLMDQDLLNFDPMAIDWKQWQSDPNAVTIGEWDMPAMPAFGDSDAWLQ